jgi:sulfonate transport system substrate-binding protein
MSQITTDAAESGVSTNHWALALRNLALGLLAVVAVLLITSFLLLPVAKAQGKGELRIGFQKGASLLVLQKAQGSLEKKLQPLGFGVKWVEFPAGPQLLEGLNVGSVDVGFVGEAPPIFAQAAGARFVYIGHDPAAPEAEAIVVPKDSAPRSVADLKGKKVALNKGSNVHYLLVKALEKQGLKFSDIQPVYLPPADERAAFERGAVDAWVIWDPFLAAAEKALEARVLADAAGVVGNRGYYFSSLPYVAKNADVLKLVVEEIDKVDQWAVANKSAYAGELSTLWGLPKAVADLSVGRAAYGTGPITRAILGEQQQIADTFFDLKLIPKKINLLEAAGAGVA